MMLRTASPLRAGRLSITRMLHGFRVGTRHRRTPQRRRCAHFAIVGFVRAINQGHNGLLRACSCIRTAERVEPDAFKCRRQPRFQVCIFAGNPGYCGLDVMAAKPAQCFFDDRFFLSSCHSRNPCVSDCHIDGTKVPFDECAFTDDTAGCKLGPVSQKQMIQFIANYGPLALATFHVFGRGCRLPLASLYEHESLT